MPKRSTVAWRSGLLLAVLFYLPKVEPFQAETFQTTYQNNKSRENRTYAGFWAPAILSFGCHFGLELGSAPGEVRVYP